MKKFKIEYLVYLIIILSPFLDASSFLYRQVYPNTSLSIATIIRPILPAILGIYIFFKDKKERKKILIFSTIYTIYGLVHLYLYKNNYTQFSYGNVIHEFQYIMNYTYMIGLFYIIHYFYETNKLKYFKLTFLMMFLSYLGIIYISILTGTSSPTYIEGTNLGYKGWFASGNALSSILILSLLVLLPYLFKQKNKMMFYITIALSWLYLTFLIGTRVGLYGFYLVIILFIFANLLVNTIKTKKVDLKRYIIPSLILIGIGITGISLIGSKTLERRKHLQEIESNLIDPSTNKISHVTGDIANFVYLINNNELEDNYMTIPQRQALLNMYKWSNDKEILNNNQRLQQIVYHTYLIKYQKDLKLMLFGNGYEINYPELTLEMEIPAMLYNFGIIGFIIYLAPFLLIDFCSIYYFFKYIKKINVEYIIYTSAVFLAIIFSFLAGYTFFNVSSMLVIILIHVLLVEQINNLKKDNYEKKKIVFGITSLSLGGAERVLVDITNKLKDKYDITIFTFYGNGEFTKELDKKIKVINMYDKKYSSLNIFQKKKMSVNMLIKPLRYLIYKRYIKNKYDVEIAFLEGPITWCFAFNSNNKKIAWVHNDITNTFGNNILSKIKGQMNKNCYKKYDDIVFVSEDNKMKFEKTLKLNNSKQVIYNYLDKDKVIDKSSSFVPKELDKKYVNFVVVSRLTNQKGIERLINVHEKLIKDNYMHYIYYIGDGPLRDKLQKTINERKIKTFKLLGKKENPYPYIKEADYFLLASYYEGYGMVIDEAKILNKYIMITDTAAREALKKYKNSLIVENNEEGIYNGIKKLLKTKNIQKIKYKYDNEYIIDQIINLIER